jgi:hypothetical protein
MHPRRTNGHSLVRTVRVRRDVVCLSNPRAASAVAAVREFGRNSLGSRVASAASDRKRPHQGDSDVA